MGAPELRLELQQVKPRSAAEPEMSVGVSLAPTDMERLEALASYHSRSRRAQAKVLILDGIKRAEEDMSRM